MSDFKNHPGLAAVLSFIFNGLGQLYNGDIKKGLVCMSLSALGMFIVIFSAILVGFNLYTLKTITGSTIIGLIALLLGIVILAIVGIYSINDAYKRASDYK